MILRQEQMDALSQAAARSFEDRMVTHLKQHFPKQCERLGKRTVRKAIREGVQSAAEYDLTAERHVCIYIELMFAFGRDFDTDPTLPWARAILNSHERGATKIARLLETATAQAVDARGLNGDGLDPSLQTMTYDEEV